MFYGNYSPTKGSDMQRGYPHPSNFTQNLTNSPQPKFMDYTIEEKDTDVNSLETLLRSNLRMESNPEI